MRKQILVVDDELSILKLLNFILSKDYDLVIKQNGADAISWLEDGNDPALIISDLEMPYIDGGSFIRNLKISGYYRDTPVILLSGANNLDRIVEQMPFQADCYFKKPFNPTELKMAIIEILFKHNVASN
jgi:two-component system, chemotaxis family, chemotaxis protein CheY